MLKARAISGIFVDLTVGVVLALLLGERGTGPNLVSAVLNPVASVIASPEGNRRGVLRRWFVAAVAQRSSRGPQFRWIFSDSCSLPVPGYELQVGPTPSLGVGPT